MAKLSPIYFNQQLFIIPFLKLTQKIKISIQLCNFKDVISISIDRTGCIGTTSSNSKLHVNKANIVGDLINE